MPSEDFPTTIQAFHERFCDEDSCYDYLLEKKYPDGYVCDSCGGAHYYYIRSRRTLECADCGCQKALKAGTIFEQTKKPLLLLFYTILKLTSSKRGVSSLEMKRLLGTKSDQTTWAWTHKFRITMVRPDRNGLNGECEVDETYVGGRKKGKSGRGANGKQVVVCAAEKVGEKGTGRIRLQMTENASSSALKEFIEGNLEKGAKVHSDGWSGYRGLNKSAYKHIVSVISGSGEAAHELFPRVHLVFSLLKDWIGGTFHGSVSMKYLGAYLDEFVFRFNRRRAKRVTQCFERLMEIAVVTDHVPYWRLIGRITSDTPLLNA